MVYTAYGMTGPMHFTIIAIDGEPVNDFQTLTVYLETETTVGDTVDVTIIRDGKELTLPVILGERPA